MSLDIKITHVFKLDRSCGPLLAAALAPLLKPLETTMSLLSDKLDALEAAISDETTEVAALNATIVDLTKKVADGLATPEELARLDGLIARVKVINDEAAVTPPAGDATPAV